MSFAAKVNLGAGTSAFELPGSEVALNGGLGSGTYAQVQYLIEHPPEVTALVFEDIPGSLNGEITRWGLATEKRDAGP